LADFTDWFELGIAVFMVYTKGFRVYAIVQHAPEDGLFSPLATFNITGFPAYHLPHVSSAGLHIETDSS
jgi:hypothetical protein